MPIAENIHRIKSEVSPQVTLVAVSKTYSADAILEAYHAGQKILGENKAQEMLGKYEQLPKDIEWHLIGHLQTNKVKVITPFVKLIHSVDSLKLLKEIDKQAKKSDRIIDCLLQIHIAREETKFGFSFAEAEQLLSSGEIESLNNIRITGLMGMATNTKDESQIRSEFKGLKQFFDQLSTNHPQLITLSTGMSSDYRIAIEEGSTMIRVGSLIFGERNYSKIE